MKKPNLCKCGLTFKGIGHRWRVIERRPGRSSRLKCLECGWKWYSKCKYVEKIEDHVEVSRKGMTDQHILDRINNGTLIVCPQGRYVRSDTKRRGWVNLKIIDRESNRSTYQFVKISHNYMQKKISLHRLVWISVHRRLVPDGYDVNHKRGKNVPNHNGIDNLELLESSVNRGLVLPDPNQSEFPY